MRREVWVKILDVFIFIALVVLVYILGAPQYKIYKENTYSAMIKTNAYTVKAAIEHYIADNIGKYPKSVADFYHYVEEESGIKNPYTGKEILEDEIKIFKYDIPSDYKDDSETSSNAQQEGIPGSIGVGFFIPIGDTVVVHYGVIGFMKNGKSLYYLDPGKKKHIYLIYG